MRDGPIRTLLKRIALANFMLNLRGTRAIKEWRGEKPFRLGGKCRLCAACCEAPGIQVGKLVWYLPTLRWLFLAWHRHVNGFVLVERVLKHRAFVFRCTHWDPKTRRCDSYETRPGMCRDYPRAHLWTPRPEFLPGCGYRAVAPNAEAMLAALEAENLPPEKLAKLKKEMFLEDEGGGGKDER